MSRSQPAATFSASPFRIDALRSAWMRNAEHGILYFKPRRIVPATGGDVWHHLVFPAIPQVNMRGWRDDLFISRRDWCVEPEFKLLRSTNTLLQKNRREKIHDSRARPELPPLGKRIFTARMARAETRKTEGKRQEGEEGATPEGKF
jgi:hypothetical protein